MKLQWDWAIRDAELDRTAKAVAWALHSRMRPNGYAAPSKQTLALDSGCSKRAVDAALQRLELAGFVTVRRGGGRGRPNRYQAVIPKGAAESVKGAERVQKGAADDTKGCSPCTRRSLKEKDSRAHAQNLAQAVMPVYVSLDTIRAYAASL